MADYGLHKNSEGYADPTAYEAIRGMAKPGEVWKYKGREVLIVKNQGSYSNILQLGDYKKGSVCVGGRLYAQPGMLSYAFNDLLTERVETLAADDFNEIVQEVADALELRLVHEEDKTVGQSIADGLRKGFDGVRQLGFSAENEILKTENTFLKAQNVMLQNMYNELLAKVIAKVGA